MFLKLKSTSKYKLFPRAGIHWSNYGCCLASDSLVKAIGKIQNKPIPQLFWNNINLAFPSGSDKDISEGLNLLFPLGSELMAYPSMKCESDSTKTKPKVFMVADSFYWVMLSVGISNSFGKSHFLYYGKMLYPESQDIETFNLSKLIDEHEIFILMATDTNLPNLGWGYIENSYKIFKKLPTY